MKNKYGVEIKFWDMLKCFFGYHLRNPKTYVIELPYYVTTCHDGDTPWYEGMSAMYQVALFS